MDPPPPPTMLENPVIPLHLCFQQTNRQTNNNNKENKQPEMPNKYK